MARDLHGGATFLCLLRARAGQLSVIPVETKRRRRKDTVEFIRNVGRCNQNVDPDEEVEHLENERVRNEYSAEIRQEILAFRPNIRPKSTE